MNWIFGFSGAPIRTQDRQCRTGREFQGILGQDWALNTYKAGCGRKTTSAMALVALASLAPFWISQIKIKMRAAFGS